MSLIRIADNSRKKIALSESDRNNLLKIVNKRIGELTIENSPNLLVFPKDLDGNGDSISDSNILSLSGDEIATGNIMGFVGVNNTQLDIVSRFAKDDTEDYFLHYLLQKVFSINLFNITHSISNQPVFDFRLYLFPYFLKKALAQGLYKKYRKFEYNDANIKGPINISQHIAKNTPFKGTIAYSVREHSCDNEITQLIRHTIEFIKTKPLGLAVMNNDSETKTCVSQIVMATPKYNLRERQRVISQNIRPVCHPYYSEYTALQKICMQILRHESIKYGTEKDKVYGVLFDGAWLWEEYLALVLKEGFEHYRLGVRTVNLFENFQTIIPDYVSKDKKIVADAKYIPLDKCAAYGEERANAIYYKTITYMYRFCVRLGFLFYPQSNEDKEVDPYKILSAVDGVNGGWLIKHSLKIPPQCIRYKDFVCEMQKAEDAFIDGVKEKCDKYKQDWCYVL